MNSDFLSHTFPEIGAGGFHRLDGTIQFYLRINALLSPEFRVLDLGAGLGAWWNSTGFKHDLRVIKGKVAEVIGHDIDPAVLHHPGVDRAITSKSGDPLPLPDSCIDLIVADYVFEHVEDPAALAAEIQRVLKPGGWICARTPNKWAYPSILTRLINNRFHTRILRFAQPSRKVIDVYPTAFKINTMKALERHFPDFDNFSYYYQPEPAYHFNSRAVFAVMRFIDWLIPQSLSANLFFFLRKRHQVSS